MLSVQHGLKDEVIAFPMTKLCQCPGVTRRTTYYKPTKGAAKVGAELVPVKEMIKAEPHFGCRTLPALLAMNKNTVQRIPSSLVGRCASARSASPRKSRKKFLAPRVRISFNRPVAHMGLQGCVADLGASDQLRHTPTAGWHLLRARKTSTALPR